MGKYIANWYPNPLFVGNNEDHNMQGHQGAELIYGYGGKDRIFAAGGNDTIYAGTGNDYVEGNSGDDTIYGEDGRDILIGDDGYYPKIGDGHDTIYGGDGDDTIYGGGGSDEIYGGDDDDFISGDGGSYQEYGKIDNPWQALAEDGHDKLYGDVGNDKIYGLGGNDFLSGGEGNDLLHGGVGADVMMGGTGSDTYYVDNVGDLVIEVLNDPNPNTDTVSVRNLYSYTLTTRVENLVLESGAERGFGNDLGNDIRGNQLSNVLSGKGGKDTLWGFEGNDLLLGGDGDDLLYGGTGNDALGGGNHNDILVGVDYVDFGKGEVDTLYGNSGADRFVLGVAQGYDRVFYNDGDSTKSGLGDYALIKDFQVGTDKLQLLGNASNYAVASTQSLGIANTHGNGVAIFRDGGHAGADELIAVLEGLTYQQFGEGSLTSNNVNFV